VLRKEMNCVALAHLVIIKGGNEEKTVKESFFLPDFDDSTILLNTPILLLA
jgi:hypothetical protein